MEVEYDYEAELQDELTIQSGDILTSVKQMSGGWWEGVLKGKRGLFPENFVKVRGYKLLSYLAQKFYREETCTASLDIFPFLQVLKTDDVTQPPPTSVKPDIGNTIQTLKEGIDIMGKKEMERANQSEEDEEKLKIEGDEVELRKSEPGEGKRCRVLFRYKLILIMCDHIDYYPLNAGIHYLNLSIFLL